MVSDERERGILSSADREYAIDPEKWSENKSRPAVNQRKKAITNRVRDSILDFEYLADEKFPQEILDSAFERPDNFDPKKDGPLNLRQAGAIDSEAKDPNIEEGFIAAVSLIYRTFSPSVANKIIERGVIRATNDFYPNHEVVDASYEPVLRPTENAYERAKDSLEEGLNLTSEQIRLLLEHGEVDPEEVAEHVQRNSRLHSERSEKAYQERRERLRKRKSDNLESEDYPEK